MLGGILSLFAASCAASQNFLAFPTWYEYLRVVDDPITGRCELAHMSSAEFIKNLPLIGLALVDIGLRVAALVAVGYIIYGGVQFVVAQGESDTVKKARQTIINALVGLIIAMLSSGIVRFIGERFGS